MKKKTKFSLGMKIVTLLTVITMASVGFASWVITAPVIPQTAAGTINVETVNDESVLLEVKWLPSYNTVPNTIVKENPQGGQQLEKNPVINFGMPADTSGITNPWLTNATVGTENLVAYLYVKVVNNSSTNTATVSAKLDGIVGTGDDKITKGNAAIAKAVTDGSISSPMIYQVLKSDGTTVGVPNNYTAPLNFDPIEANGTAEYIIKIEFNWGTDFCDDPAVDAPENAYIYFNKNGYTAEKHTKADEALSELYANVFTAGLSYQVTVTVA